MPQVVGPENLPSELELTQQRAHLIPEHMREKLLCPKPIEFRPVTEEDPYNPKASDPVKYVWFRADGAMADSPALHKYLLAYASDFGLLTTSMLPHGKSVCGSTPTCAPMTGCCMRWTARGPAIPAASPVAACSTAPGNWWLRSLRKA
jgi:acyl-CoA thioesterase II